MILGATRDRMLREIREALDAFASEKPVLYVYDDVHWLDLSSLNLLSAFARQSIEGQIDQLNLEEQHALEAASVAGASFSALGLAGVTGISRAQLLELFETLRWAHNRERVTFTYTDSRRTSLLPTPLRSSKAAST